VIGVLPAGAVVDRVSAEVYVPLVFTPERARDQGRSLTALGRLAPDVTLEQARDRLAAVAAAFNATRGPAGDGWSSAITPWRDVVVRADSRRLVLILFGAVGLVLAIACANVAALALARATARRRELAIRAALGAGRWRVMRYLTLESVLLGALGGAAGLVVGSWTLEALASLMPAGVLPADATIGLDGRALLFTAAAAIGTGVVFGILPAWQAARSVAVGSALVGDGRTQSASRATGRLYAILVIAEMALAMVLVSGAVLLVTSFVRLGAVSPGFDPAPLLTFRLAHASGNPGGTQATRLLERVTSALDAVPGVARSAAVTSLPLGGWLYGARFAVEGRPDDPDRPTFAHIQRVTPGYFETLELSMAEGRTFASFDDERAPRRAIVNETFAARHLVGADRLGQRLRLGIATADGGQNEIREIVGVARDVKTGGLADAALATPEIYVPQAQSPIGPAYLVARAAAGDAAALEPVIRRTLRELDPRLAIDDVRTMHERIGVSLRLERFRTTMISGFAVLASLLAGFGIYSVRARAVAARRREMGIRLALGATPGEVLRLVLRQGLTLAAVGVALGLAGAAYSAHLIEQWLFETAPTDPGMVAAAIVLVGLPALAASWLPARRAASVSPTETLRGE
jgi:putative ABC transport system permease protein